MSWDHSQALWNTSYGLIVPQNGSKRKVEEKAWNTRLKWGMVVVKIQEKDRLSRRSWLILSCLCSPTLSVKTSVKIKWFIFCRFNTSFQICQVWIQKIPTNMHRQQRTNDTDNEEKTYTDNVTNNNNINNNDTNNNITKTTKKHLVRAEIIKKYSARTAAYINIDLVTWPSKVHS